MSDSGRRIGRLALGVLLAAGGCGGAECVTQTTQYTATVNTVGYFGPMTGQPIARFDLTQDFITHTPYEACAQGPLQDVGNVDLKITSLVSKPIFLKYDVQGLDETGIPVWSHADTLGVTIAPNQTLAVGQIITTPRQLGNGGARVLLQAAEYVP